MLVVGLTGGISSGKTTVSKLIQEHHNDIPLIDLDVLAREVVLPGSSTLNKIRSTFGDEVISSNDGTLNRPALGRIIFNDEHKRKRLNSIIHPAIRRRLAWLLFKYWFKGKRLVVVDAPLLVEAGLWKLAGRIVLVYCSDAIQLQRLIARAGPDSDVQDAKARISSQMPLSDKLVYADYIIDNSGDLTDLDRQVEDVVNKLKRSSNWLTWLICWLVPPFGMLKALLTIFWRLKVKKVGKGKRGKKR